MCCFGPQLFSVCHPLLHTGKKWVPISVQQKEKKKPGLDNLETSLSKLSWKFHICQSSKILENVLLWWTVVDVIYSHPPPPPPPKKKHLREGLANGNKTRECECLLFLYITSEVVWHVTKNRVKFSQPNCYFIKAFPAVPCDPAIFDSN